MGCDSDFVDFSVALVLRPSVELIQLHCGRNKTVIRFSTLKFIVLLLLLFPMVHSGISKYLSFSLPPSLHPSLSLFFPITAVAVTAEVIRA